MDGSYRQANTRVLEGYFGKHHDHELLLWAGGHRLNLP